jgi:pimeloyl-ACP methyl ester carboxylesterase
MQRFLTRQGAVAAGAALTAVGAAWEVQRRSDRRHVRADPMHDVLANPPQGRPVAVRSPDGTSLHAEIAGRQDAPTIVLAHGWTCALRFWQQQVRDLATDFRIVTYDLRGHGRSERARTADYSMEAFADDLQAVLETCVPEGERVVLAGHSLGAMTIVAWAGRRPEEVRRRASAAALINTGVGDLITDTLVVRLPTPLGRLKQAVGGAVLAAPAAMPSGPTPLMFRAMRYIALSPSASPATVAFCEQLILDCPPDVRGACGRSLSRLELMDAVAHLDVPTLVIAGERDRLTPPVHAERLAEALPQAADTVVIDDVGHMAPLEAHEQVTACLRALATTATGPRTAPSAAA